MPNSKPIRRAQLIYPFGVGALVDFRGDESLMTAGLDEWPLAKEICPADWLVREERLQLRLGMNHFRLPPEHREPELGVEYPNQFIPFIRFPRWHYCPRCRLMKKLELYSPRTRCLGQDPLIGGSSAGSGCRSLPEQKRLFMIPSRFVAVCPRGHIEDFPFMHWVHRGGSWDQTHTLRLLPGRLSGGLTGISVTCSCGQSRTMRDTFNFSPHSGGALHQMGYDCSGCMPWLGKTGTGAGLCGEFLRVVQRGASNVYFPQTVSSIYLPLWGEGKSRTINRMLEKPHVWDILVGDGDSGRYIRSSECKAVAAVLKVDCDELREAAQRKLEGTASSEGRKLESEEEFRRQEYDAFRTGRGGDTTDLMVEVGDLTLYGGDLAEMLENVCLVKKLRETRVLIGFSRLVPAQVNGAAEGLPIKEDQSLRWLPASVVYGEGIFLALSAHRVREWSNDPLVVGRVNKLKRHYDRDRSERGLEGLDISPEYVLLHTFAHALISQLSFDCGYGSAALRERVYCGSGDCDRPMQGVLIYTASGDSEGTLGGLVRQGRPDRLKTMIARAIHRMQWCSSDPVCIESSGQGSDNSNLAACHGCVLLPETSCEKGKPVS